MGFADLTAFDETAKSPCTQYLAGMGTGRLNLLIEGNRGAAQRLERHRSGHIRCIGQPFSPKQRQHAYGRHRLSAVQQRQTLFCLQGQWLYAGLV